MVDVIDRSGVIHSMQLVDARAEWQKFYVAFLQHVVL
jgi:hypothetical protein